MPLVISPHLDDAVLSCGRWLAAHPGSVVLTLFAGAPRDASLRTGWDAQCGFDSAGQAVAARRGEDARALAILGAAPRWLDFADGQYDEGVPVAALAAALRAVLLDARPAAVLYPLGLFHADHRRAHDAAVAALDGLDGLGIDSVLAYEDVPYRGMPGVLQQRLAALAAAGVQATPACAAAAAADDTAAALKTRAIAAYPSQLRAFGGTAGLADATLPERLWHLVPPAAAAPR